MTRGDPKRWLLPGGIAEAMSGFSVGPLGYGCHLLLSAALALLAIIPVIHWHHGNWGESIHG